MLNCHRERRSLRWVTSPPLTCSGSLSSWIRLCVHIYYLVSSRTPSDVFQSFFLSYRLIVGFIKRFGKVSFHSLLPPEAERSTTAHLFYKILGKTWRHCRCLLFTVSKYVYDMWSVCSTELLCGLKLSVCQTEPFGVITITMNRWTHTPKCKQQVEAVKLIYTFAEHRQFYAEIY